MDLWGIFMFFFLTFLIMSCCGYCCTTKRRGAVLSTPVVVTSATHTAPGGYPVTQMQAPGGYQTNVYATTAPYPTQHGSVTVQMPMPMHMGQQPVAGMQYGVAYPPMPMPQQQQLQQQQNIAANMNPPTYDMAVAGNSAGQPNNASYEKQQPYNPSYNA